MVMTVMSLSDADIAAAAKRNDDEWTQRATAESYWNPSNPPPEPRYAERQPTVVQDLKAPSTGVDYDIYMLRREITDQGVAMRRVADLLEKILARL